MNRNKYVKRVLLSLLIFILSFSLISVTVTFVVFQTAFPRSDTPSAFSMRYTDADEASCPATPLRFYSGENALSGYCYHADDPAALVVIAAGFRESGAVYLPEVKAFVDSGYSVFCYDATGVGESEGKGTVGLSQPSLDLHAALKYIGADPALSRLPILLYGASAGGYAAATCLDDRSVKAAVILSGFESPTLLMRETARNYVGILADIEYPFLYLGNSFVFRDEGNQSASACIEASTVPVAVFEGANDTIVPPSARLSAFLPPDIPGLTLTVCGGSRSGHGDLRLSDDAVAARENGSADLLTANTLDPAYIQTVLRFFDSVS